MAKYKNVTVLYYSKVHAIATCSECDWSDEDYRTATQTANKHCKDYGHTVRVEKAVGYDLVPKNPV